MIENYLPVDIFITEYLERNCKILLHQVSKSMVKYDINRE